MVDPWIDRALNLFWQQQQEKPMFRAIRPLLARMWADNRGIDAIEFAVLAGIVAVILIAAMTTVGQTLSTTIQNVSSSV